MCNDAHYVASYNTDRETMTCKVCPEGAVCSTAFECIPKGAVCSVPTGNGTYMIPVTKFATKPGYWRTPWGGGGGGDLSPPSISSGAASLPDFIECRDLEARNEARQ